MTISINQNSSSSTNTLAIQKRYYYGLDELRAALMLIGVFWHAACILAPSFNFVYSSPYHKSALIYRSVYPEHIFRMEAFYLVSGFLSYMIISRKGKKEFIRARIKRVLIPLVLGCFGVNLFLQIYGSLTMGYRWAHFDMWRWVMHGWFLITLFVCALIDLILPKVFYKNQKFGIITMLFAVWFIYCSCLYFNGDYWHFFGAVSSNLFNFFILNTLSYYPFYYFGALLFINQDKLDRIPTKAIYFLGALALFAGGFEYLYHFKFFDIEVYPSLRPFLQRIIATVAALSCSLFLFIIFYRSKRQANKVIRYLINSAIVIYLVHHPLLIIFGKLLDFRFLSNGGYYFLLVTVVFAVSYGLYELIRRYSISRFIFGLK